MADITNEDLTGFVVNRARMYAAAWKALYYDLLEAIDEYNVLGGDAAFPDADVIIDGAASDGRITLHGADIRGFMALAGAMKTDLEANSNTNLNRLLEVGMGTQSL